MGRDSYTLCESSARRVSRDFMGLDNGKAREEKGSSRVDKLIVFCERCRGTRRH